MSGYAFAPEGAMDEMIPAAEAAGRRAASYEEALRDGLALGARAHHSLACDGEDAGGRAWMRANPMPIEDRLALYRARHARRYPKWGRAADETAAAEWLAGDLTGPVPGLDRIRAARQAHADRCRAAAEEKYSAAIAEAARAGSDEVFRITELRRRDRAERDALDAAIAAMAAQPETWREVLVATGRCLPVFLALI